MSDVQWAGVAQHKIDFKRIGELIENSLKFIPAVPKPYVNGEITFKTFTKSGCCSSNDTGPTTINKGSIGGKANAGVKTGELPLPGLSIPGVGGAYISASAGVGFELSGSSEQICNLPYNKLCANGTVSGDVSLGGGLTILSGWISGGIEGKATVKGTAVWCEESGLTWKRVCLDGVVNAVLLTPFGTTTYEIAGLHECA